MSYQFLHMKFLVEIVESKSVKNKTVLELYTTQNSNILFFYIISVAKDFTSFFNTYTLRTNRRY